MTTTTLTDTIPRIWVGCLACYNSARLVGEWFDATEGDDITLADVHGGAQHVRSGCEEIWVMDHENLPIRGECSPHDAAQLAHVVEEVHENDREAFLVWALSGDQIEDGDGLPSASDFEERYCGTWESFEAYAENLGEDIALLDGIPDEIARYFDWRAWARDLAFDYTTSDAPEGGVFVFRSL